MTDLTLECCQHYTSKRPTIQQVVESLNNVNLYDIINDIEKTSSSIEIVEIVTDKDDEEQISRSPSILSTQDSVRNCVEREDAKLIELAQRPSYIKSGTDTIQTYTSETDGDITARLSLISANTTSINLSNAKVAIDDGPRSVPTQIPQSNKELLQIFFVNFDKCAGSKQTLISLLYIVL